MAEPTKIINNPIEPLISGFKGNYGVFWQVISFCLLLYAYRMLTIGWNGLNGRGCGEGARIELTSPDSSVRAIACGSRAFLELIAGDDVTPTPAPAPTDPAPNLIEGPQ